MQALLPFKVLCNLIPSRRFQMYRLKFSRQVCCFCGHLVPIRRQHALCGLFASVRCGQPEQHALYAGLQQETDNTSDSHHVWSSSCTSLVGDCQVPGGKIIFSQCCGKRAKEMLTQVCSMYGTRFMLSSVGMLVFEPGCRHCMCHRCCSVAFAQNVSASYNRTCYLAMQNRSL